MQETRSLALPNTHVQILRLPNYNEVIRMPSCRTSVHHCESDLNNVSSTLALIHPDPTDAHEINSACCWSRKWPLSLCCVISSSQQIGRFCGIGCGVALLFLLAGASFFTTAVLRQSWQPMGWIGFAFFTAGFTLVLIIITVVFSGWISPCNSNISETAVYRCRQHAAQQAQPTHLQLVSNSHTSRHHRRTFCCSHWGPPPPSYQESEAFADSQIVILEHSNWTGTLSRPPSYQSRQVSVNEAPMIQAAVDRPMCENLMPCCDHFATVTSTC